MRHTVTLGEKPLKELKFININNKSEDCCETEKHFKQSKYNGTA